MIGRLIYRSTCYLFVQKAHFSMGRHRIFVLDGGYARTCVVLGLAVVLAAGFAAVRNAPSGRVHPRSTDSSRVNPRQFEV